MTGVEVISFGCRLNALESQVMQHHATNAGLTNAIIVNTCAVTKEAERQARQAIRRLRRERPEARIIVSGCAAQIKPSTFAEMEEVDQVLGNIEKLDVASYRPDAPQDRTRVSDIMAKSTVQDTALSSFRNRCRAFIQVQQGCDHRCTFCIIPFGRGNSCSVPLDTVIERVRQAVENGYLETVLTGVDISSYGREFSMPSSLGELATAILDQVPELQRVRLSSRDPAVDDPALLALTASEERLMPHFHLSLQSGHDTILKRMRRRHNRADAVALCNRLRDVRPDITFGADLIVGFPTEDRVMFRATLDLIEDCDLTRLHVFPYSQRPGTPAARMPQTAPSKRKARAAELRTAGRNALNRYMTSRKGSRARVLVETGGCGYIEQYVPARLNRPASTGTIVQVTLLGHDDGQLIVDTA